MDNINLKELKAGDTLQGGTYLIERTIGVDDFSITYTAKNTQLNFVCAVKELFINDCCVRNVNDKTIIVSGMEAEIYEKRRQKFIEDAQTLTCLDHPNVAKVTDIFAENNTAYMATSFTEGESLQKIVEQQGKLSYKTAANYISQLSETVGYIHGRDILHGNIEPDNIIITPDDKVVLINFGSTYEFADNKMQTGAYASPEQYTAGSRKGTWSDIYSLGAVFYFVLTGQKPTNAVTCAIETLPEPQALVSSIPAAANRTILKAMQLKPENRHQTALEFMKDLLDDTVKDRPQVQKNRPPEQTDRQVSGKGESVTTDKQKKSSLNWIFMAVAIVLGIVSVYLILQKISLQNQLDTTLANNETLTTQLTGVNNTLSSIKKISPLIISEIEVGVIKRDGTGVVEPGETIYSSQTRYLSPYVTGISLLTTSSSQKIYVKLYNAYDILVHGNDSPTGYTYAVGGTIPYGNFQNISMGGWGSDTAGTWTGGTYKFELWYDDRCIGVKEFQIHY